MLSMTYGKGEAPQRAMHAPHAALQAAIAGGKAAAEPTQAAVAALHPLQQA